MYTGKASAAVRSALESRGMSIRELSRRAGVGYSTARNGINGISAMQARHFLRYCIVLDIDLQGALINGQTYRNNPIACGKTLQERQKEELKKLTDWQTHRTDFCFPEFAEKNTKKTKKTEKSGNSG